MSSTNHGAKNSLPLTLAALGVVFGDIGTSPLYAINEIFFSRRGLAITEQSVLGCISLVIWALAIVVALKYVFFVLRADNEGEGGVFALYGLLHGKRENQSFIGVQGLLWLLILAAGLLFGDGCITPAISVLSAVEGLEVITPALKPFVFPATLLILTLLFSVQARGTSKMGAIFGPIVVLWFLSLSVFGFSQLLAQPKILLALNPAHAISFLINSPLTAILIAMGGVILAIAGSEALYADMGHFGKKPIRLSWFLIVFPSLLVNYLGQGAYLLSGRAVVGGSLFFSMVPRPLVFPAVLLATMATVIASQALISGAFSLASQAVALGLFPRLRIIHTHHEHEGQIYSPFVNWLLYLGCVLLVVNFKTSTSLASAYGLAEAGVMTTTSIAMIAVSRMYWDWRKSEAFAIFGLFAAVDISLLISNSVKFLDGGYVPLLIGLAIFIVMATWRWGRKTTFAAYSSVPSMTLRELIELKDNSPTALERNAIVMVPRPLHSLDERVPALMQLLWQRHGLLPKNLVFVEVIHRKIPYVHSERCDVRVFQKSSSTGSIVSVTIQFGFMETPDVEQTLESLASHHDINLDPSPKQWIVHVMQENLLPNPRFSPLNSFRFRLFSLLRQISTPGYYYYGMGRAVQLSVEIFPVKLQ